MNIRTGEHTAEQLKAAIAVRDIIGIQSIESITPFEARIAMFGNHIIEHGNPMNTTLGPCAVCHRTTERYGIGGSPICTDCKEGAHA